jgi:condensin complex subunit 2
MLLTPNTLYINIHPYTFRVDAIFEKQKSIKGNKKTKKDQYQMPQAEKDFLLPPDANVDISQLTRLFSRPNAIVRKSNVGNKEHGSKTVGFYDVEDNALGFVDDDKDFGGNDDGGFTFAYDDEDDEPRDDDADYNIDFEEVRKVEKIDIAYATVAKKVDVRRLKQDLWAELEDKTVWTAPPIKEDAAEEEKGDDIYEEGPLKGEPRFVSFKETVEKMEMSPSQSDVTVSFYFICCLHLANEKGLKLDSTGLEDFVISLDDGSAPTFGTFGDGFTETANKLSGANSRSKRDIIKAVSYDEGDEE